MNSKAEEQVSCCKVLIKPPFGCMATAGTATPGGRPPLGDGHRGSPAAAPALHDAASSEGKHEGLKDALPRHGGLKATLILAFPCACSQVPSPGDPVPCPAGADGFSGFYKSKAKPGGSSRGQGLSLLRPRQRGCWLRHPRAPCLVFLETSPHATGSAVPPHRKMCIFAPALHR